MTGDTLAALGASLGPRYTVQRQLGRGGWATVYLAIDHKHARPVAIKVFHPELAFSLGTERFLQEIRLVAQFQHPHILPLHDSGETAEAPYYVMPYVEGESLRQRLERVTRLAVPEALSIAQDVAGALAYAHERGVVHRDIKPENILLSGDHALVADFGIALAIRAATGEPSTRGGRGGRGTPAGRISRPGLAVGTPAYMSPEQALGELDPDQRSDVYSLGVIVYEMLAGATPYPETSLQSVVDRHLSHGRPTPLAEVRDDVPRAVSDAVARALAVEPDRRFATAREFAEALTPASRTSAAPRRRRAIVAGAALLALAAGVWLWRGPSVGGRGAPDSPTAVAVFPFTVRGGADYAFLGPGMVDLLATDLDGAGDLRGVNAHAVLATSGADPDAVTPERAGALARRLGAGLYVLGSVLESGGRIRINASLYDRARPAAPLATASVDGRVEKLFELVDALATQLVAEGRGGPAGHLTRVAAVTTRSLPAFKSYLEGEALLRAGRYDSAMVAFDRATAEDSTFALAYYRRAVAANWNADFEQARESAARAVRFGSHLSEDDRALLEALLAWDRGDAADAERLYRAVLREHPDNVEAWYNLGEVLFHYGPIHGGTMRDARPAFERALALDPQMSDARLHLMDVAAKERRFTDFDSLLRHLPEGPLRVRRRAVLAFATGPRARQDSALAELRTASDATVIVAAWMAATYLEDLDAAGRIAALLLRPERPPPTQAYGGLLLAQADLGRGRWRDAQRRLDAVAAHDSAMALEYRAFFAAAPFTPAPDDSLRALQRRLVAWDAEAVPPITAPGISLAIRIHDRAHPLLRLYLVAALGARLRDDGESARAEQELRHRAAAALPPAATNADSAARALAAELAASARVVREWYGGRPPEALAAVERMRARASVDRAGNSPFYSHLLERFLRAEALHAAGRAREAAAYYRSLQEGHFDAAFLAPTHLRLAEIADRAGDRATAIFHYGRVLDLWSSPDPELRPVVERARERRDALRRE
jgi:serine/threonine-protein kinase